MKKNPRVDVALLHGHRGAAVNLIRPDKPKGVLDSDAVSCFYCRLALGKGEAVAESWEASFDGLCAWHKAHALAGS
jgi:hypothetical protein